MKTLLFNDNGGDGQIFITYMIRDTTMYIP